MAGFAYKDAVAHKWGEKLLSEGFVPFPKRLLRCAPQVFKGELRMSELCAVLAIVDYQRPQVTRKPSLDHLASVAGLTETKFRSCLRSLKKRKLLDWSGTEAAMDFNYEGLKKLAIEKTSKLEDEEEGAEQDDGDE